MTNTQTVGVVLAAGSGQRFKNDLPKQFVDLNGKPVICYSIESFEQADCVDSICVVVSKEYLPFVKELIASHNYQKVHFVIEGGKERFHSVLAAIETIKDCKHILFHDAARPLLTQDVIRRIVDELEECSACTAALPTVDTVAMVDNDQLTSIPKRDTLWNIQTPQAFDFATIKEAYDIASVLGNYHEFTNDCGLVKYFFPSINARVVKGSPYLKKITYIEDIDILSNMQKKIL